MADVNGSGEQISVTVKRKSKKKAGFEVERRDDGFYYITKVPKTCKKVGVGDRVLEINGTVFEEFENEEHANELVESFRLEVVKAYEDDDDDEEWETGKRNAKRISDGYDDGYDNYDNYGEGWNNGDQMPDWDNQGYDNFHSNGTEARPPEGMDRSTSWDRQYVSKYKPNDRFMISITKEEEENCYDLGIDLVEFRESEIYVSDVNQGPFYETALNRGDKIISINGKKMYEHITTVEEAMEIIDYSSKLTIFVLRPSKKDDGYNWVLENT